MSELSFFLVGVPPSLNKVGASKSWHAWNRHKKHWQQDVEMWLMAEKMPRNCDYAEVSAVLRFPTRRRRDQGNFQALLDKAIGDALVNGGWLPDDTPQYYKFAGLVFDEEVGDARTTITVAWKNDGASRQNSGAGLHSDTDLSSLTGVEGEQ